MAFDLSIPFFAFRLRLVPDGAFYMPLHDKNVLRLNQPMHLLAGKYAETFQRKLLNKGDYQPLMDHQIKGTFKEGVVCVSFPKAKDSVSFPKFDLEFDYYAQDRGEGLWAILPALGVESYAANLEELEQRLIEAVKLDFARYNRLISIQELVSSIWYNEIVLEKETLDLKTFSLKELEDTTEETGEKLLPQVATELQISHQVVYGLKKELEQLSRAIKGKFNKNVLLVGPSGVGKTALVWELVRQQKKRKIKELFWETTASILIKELMRDTGWEANLGLLCKELAGSDNILFVRNLMELFEVGQYVGNDMSMADYLLSYISRGEVILVSECTEEELAQIDLRNPSFTSFFQIIRIQEPNDDLENIIEQKVKDIAQHKSVVISEDAIQEVIRLNRRFTPYSGMPGKPIRFLESIILNRKSANSSTNEHLAITRSEVIRHFCEDTGMPAFIVDPTIPMHIDHIKGQFNANVFGQELAVESVVDVVASVKTAMMRTGKPIASFLFVGPTGVGKTELAKVLAGFMFGSRERMVRFDMSEYSNPYSVMQLIGTSYGSDGLLTAAVRREPFCVLLFDEIEKADSTFYDFLLQVLSEGRLTDSRGKLVNFCSSIIIMTSNIGAQKLQGGNIQLGAKEENDLKDHYVSAVEQHFRPELYNRIDRIIPFSALDQSIVRFVVDREIALFRRREGIQFRRIDLSIENSVLEYLAKEGYHEKYGARHIQRTIRQDLVIPLAEALNGQDFDDQFLVTVKMQDDRPTVFLEVDPLGLDLLIEELDQINQADHASRLRRQISVLEESMFFIQLKSELESLEKEKNREKEQFWQNQQKAERYSYYLQTKSNVERLTEEIAQYEETLSMGCLNLQAYDTSLNEKLEAWEVAFFELKIELYTRLHPKSNTCYLGVYGSHLHTILEFYQNLFDHKGFLYEAYGVWFRDSYYNEEVELGELHPEEEFDDPTIRIKRQEYIKVLAKSKNKQLVYEPDKKGDILCGVEFVIAGTCAFLFLEPEYGGQKWCLNEDNYASYFVQAAEEVSKSPVGIHRKEFFSRLPIRRQIELDTIRDNNYRINREYRREQLIPIILEQMDLLFEENLDKALLE